MEVNHFKIEPGANLSGTNLLVASLTNTNLEGAVMPLRLVAG
jgi:hypothetical protein